MLTDNSSNTYRNSAQLTGDRAANIVDSLFEFLKAAELQHYFDALNAKLKVRSIAQLKYVDDTDLQSVGMSRPEMRRLKKFFAKEFPQTAIGKIKKCLSRTTSCRSTSVPRPQDCSTRMNSYSVRVSSNGQCGSPVDSDELTTIASVTNFSIASNTTTDSAEWRQTGGKHLILPNQLTLGPLVHHRDMVDIYKGGFRSEQVNIEVAVKVINKITLQNQFNDFLREMFTNCYLDHPNVMKLIGISLDDCNIKLVTELSLCGSLNQCLSADDSKTSYPITVLHGFVIQISDAMSYLEEHRVVHGRLIGTNVLLSSDNQVKVTDAGLFRVHNNLDPIIPPDQYSLWMSPEIIKGFKETVHSDVWAFGVLLWEMYSYYQHPCLSHMDESVSSQVDMRLQWLQQPDLCPNMLYQIIQLCWTDVPKERPSFYQLSTQLIRLEPEQLVALVDGPDLLVGQRAEDTNEPSDGSYSSLSEIQMLDYKTNDTIIVLDRSMNQYKELWRGCLLSGRCGYFKWSNMRALLADSPPKIDNKQKASPDGSVKSGGRSIGETFSKIRISRREEKRKVSIDMISGPQNDFRHVGHVGANGDVFGDVTSLYATGAQKNTGKPVSTRSEHSEAITINHHPVEHPTMMKKAPPEKVAKKRNNTTNMAQSAQPAPPLPPIRSHAEEERNSNFYLDDLTLGNNYPMSNDDFSLFEELSKHWEMHSSKIESPTSDTIVSQSLHNTSLLSSSPDRESPSFNAGYSEVYDEPVRSLSICDPVIPPTKDMDQHSSKTQRSASMLPSSVTVESNVVKSNLFQKLRVFGSGKPSKSKELSDGQKSPIYARLNKALKPKKQKECTENKKNTIGMPLIISHPVGNPNGYVDDNFFECSSEVSSLQPSPRDSALCLMNSTLTDRSPSIYHQASNNHRKTSDSTNTSISPASSFTSLTTSATSTAVLQGGGALRALRKGDCVFRATSAVNTQTRKRPSVGDIQVNQYLNDGIISRTCQQNKSSNGGVIKLPNPAPDSNDNFGPKFDNYEDLDDIRDSSATTPIASDLPDLPYIDLSFVHPGITDKNHHGDEDDAYNSLHSGSLGSDTIEPRSATRQSELSSDGGDLSGHATLNTSITDHVVLATNNHTDISEWRPKNGSKYSFNNSKIFAMLGDNDEVAL